MWACAWNEDDPNYVYAGLNGSICVYDIRNTAGCVSSLQREGDRAPVTSLSYVPLCGASTFRYYKNYITSNSHTHTHTHPQCQWVVGRQSEWRSVLAERHSPTDIYTSPSHYHTRLHISHFSPNVPSLPTVCAARFFVCVHNEACFREVKLMLWC